LQEPRPRRLLEVLLAGEQDRPAVLVTTEHVLQLGHLRGKGPARVLQCCAPLGQRGGLPVEPLDLALEPLALGRCRGHSLAHSGQALVQPRALPLVARERSPERLHLRPTGRGLLEQPAALVLGLPPRLDLREVLALRPRELLLPTLELLGHLGQASADPPKVLVEGAQPGLLRRLAGQPGAGGGLGLHRSAELELRRRLLALSSLERGLAFLKL